MAKTPKSDEPCYTKKSKSGKAYTTCEGAQKKRAKQRAGKKRSPEENAQKAGLKVQKLQIKRNAKRPIKGRIETGPLNPGKITSVSFPKPKAPTDAKKQIGRKNLDELLTLGDLSAKIESERKKLVTGEWYIVPITYLIGELYKKGLRDFKGTPLEGDGGRFGIGSTREGWSVVYQLKGDKMVNVFRLRLSLLHSQALTSFLKPSELTSSQMLIDNVFDVDKNKEAMKYLEERSGGQGAIGKSFDVKGIKHLRDVNLSKDKWALKLGIKMTRETIDGTPRITLPYSDFSLNPWRNVPWAKDGETLLTKLTSDANKKYVSENKDKLSKMKVKELKEKVGGYINTSKMKKADYVDYILERGQTNPSSSNNEWSSLIKNGR